MKLGQAKTGIIQRPFVHMPKLSITVHQNHFNEIQKFSVTYFDHKNEFEVKSKNILSAWKELEKWLNKIDQNESKPIQKHKG